MRILEWNDVLLFNFTLQILTDNVIGVIDRDSDFNFNILLDKKLYKEKDENILIYDISYKTSTNAKPWRMRFNKIDAFIKTHNGIRCLVLFDYGWFDKMSDRIKYLISEKSGITDSINQNFGKIRSDSYNSLPVEKILTFHNLIILIKSVFIKNKNQNNYIIFLEKGSDEDKSNTEYF